jgi:hypothetical protein
MDRIRHRPVPKALAFFLLVVEVVQPSAYLSIFVGWVEFEMAMVVGLLEEQILEVEEAVQLLVMPQAIDLDSNNQGWSPLYAPSEHLCVVRLRQYQYHNLLHTP